MTDQKEDKQWQIIRDLKKEIRELETKVNVQKEMNKSIPVLEERIKDLEAERDNAVRALNVIQLEPSLTHADARGIIRILREKATGSEDEIDEAVNSGIEIGINAIINFFAKKGVDLKPKEGKWYERIT